MAYSDLREFIKVLEKNKELKRITVPVSSDQEITEITDRVSKSKENNKALLFENVDDGGIPVLINALGSRRRMELALEVDNVEDVAARLTEWLDFKSPQGLARKGEDDAEAGRAGQILSARGEIGVLPGSDQTRRRVLFVRLSDSKMLGSRRRQLHYLPDGLHAQPAHGQTKLRNVPDADLRRKDHRHALADSQTWRGSSS